METFNKRITHFMEMDYAWRIYHNAGFHHDDQLPKCLPMITSKRFPSNNQNVNNAGWFFACFSDLDLAAVPDHTDFRNEASFEILTANHRKYYLRKRPYVVYQTRSEVMLERLLVIRTKAGKYRDLHISSKDMQTKQREKQNHFVCTTNIRKYQKNVPINHELNKL
jgi:hypothetical protein